MQLRSTLPRQLRAERFEQLARAALPAFQVVVAVEKCALLGEGQPRVRHPLA